MLDETSLDDLRKNKFSEKRFKLSLPALVEGKNQSGRRFKEKTILSYISHRGSSFWLTNSVSLGSELRLTIDLPSNLSKKGPKKRVSLNFENKYIIKANR